MKRLLILLFATVFLLASNTAVAQDRFGAELRIGPEFATQDLGDANLSTGFGSELVFSYRFYSDLAAYAGWGYSRSAIDGPSFVGNDADVEQTGYTFGLQFVRPVQAQSKTTSSLRSGARYGYFVRAGGIYNHIEIESDGGNLSADSGHGMGWQIGAGPVLAFGRHWTVMPGLRYRALSRDIEVGEVNTDVDRTYFSVGVGLMRTF